MKNIRCAGDAAMQGKTVKRGHPGIPGNLKMRSGWRGGNGQGIHTTLLVCSAKSAKGEGWGTVWNTHPPNPLGKRHTLWW